MFFLFKFIWVLLQVYLVHCDDFALQVPRSELVHRPLRRITLQTDLGRVIGYKQAVAGNRTINVFYGLPFAEAPIGELRFRRPKPIDQLPTDPYSALDFKPHCPMVSNNYHPDDAFSEDCLFLNIWSPNLDQFKANGVCSKKFDVMLYIVGGNH